VTAALQVDASIQQGQWVGWVGRPSNIIRNLGQICRLTVLTAAAGAVQERHRRSTHDIVALAEARQRSAWRQWSHSRCAEMSLRSSRSWGCSTACDAYTTPAEHPRVICPLATQLKAAVHEPTGLAGKSVDNRWT
jgi:hypothetical protein